MAENERSEIIVVKRRAAHEDAHHGGAWKIAFADFMTAMMALFLVLWLISSTSDKTKHAVAQYFNPVKLVDVTTLKRGLRDPKKTETPSASKKAEAKEDAQAGHDAAEAPQAQERPAGAARGVSDATLFRDPYAALEEIAASAPRPAPRPAAAERAPDGASATEDSEAFLDPFTTAPRLVRASGQAPDKPPAEADRKAAEPAPAEAGPLEAKRAGAEAKPREDHAGALKAEIAGKLAALGAQAPRVDVEATGEGLLVSLTDDRNFAMFKVGSAVPEPQTIKAMGVVGALLKERPGVIVLRGHTDARPYKSGDYDNWRLSAARAHMAHYMLVRGGLDDKRVERIEGYADRRLKVPADPLAPANRRIEILVRKEKP
ncbi:flagellar motor protein MotB [Methylocella sp.]|uniref:flagellar motor protein MotB n=1 Tax=Methylocella sp. TaxID=1978226 RepID=UPI0037846FAD